MPRKIFTVNADRQKLSVWLNYWLEVYAKPNLTTSTLKGYKSAVNKHIIPKMGDIPICNLSTKKLQTFFNEKALKSDNSITLSEKSMKNLFDVLHIALELAVETGIIHENYLDDVIIPKCREREERYLLPKEQEILVEYADKHKNISAFGIILILNTGIKKRELLALKWSDIDDYNRYIDLPDRKIPLTDSCYKRLLMHKYRQRKLMEKTSCVQNDDTYVITNRKFTRYTSEGYNKLIQCAAFDSGFEAVTATVLRNTFGYNCLMCGTDLPTLSYIMGDCNVNVTRKRYRKLLEQLENKRKS